MCDCNAWGTQPCKHKYDDEDRCILITILYDSLARPNTSDTYRPGIQRQEIWWALRKMLPEEQWSHLFDFVLSNRLQVLQSEGYIQLVSGWRWVATEKLAKAYAQYQKRMIEANFSPNLKICA